MPVNVGNFDITKQCPQIYIYIFSVLTALIVLTKTKDTEKVIATLIAGFVSTIMLMGINYCDWTFQWLTWVFSAFYLVNASADIVRLLKPEDPEQK